MANKPNPAPCAPIVQIAGESYRLKDKRKAGSIKATAKNQ